MQFEQKQLRGAASGVSAGVPACSGWRHRSVQVALQVNTLITRSDITITRHHLHHHHHHRRLAVLPRATEMSSLQVKARIFRYPFLCDMQLMARDSCAQDEISRVAPEASSPGVVMLGRPDHSP